MRMDIKISPGALIEPDWPAARHDWGHAGGVQAEGGGGIQG
jgi:predicted Zn-dependent protease